jgi:hypothetical protein
MGPNRKMWYTVLGKRNKAQIERVDPHAAYHQIIVLASSALAWFGNRQPLDSYRSRPASRQPVWLVFLSPTSAQFAHRSRQAKKATAWPTPVSSFASCVALCHSQLASTYPAQLSAGFVLVPQRLSRTGYPPPLALAAVVVASRCSSLSGIGPDGIVAWGLLVAVARAALASAGLPGFGSASDQTDCRGNQGRAPTGPWPILGLELPSLWS